MSMRVNRVQKLYALVMALVVLLCGAPALANTCSTATTQGTAPPEWQTYCWLDFTGYNDATAKSAAGQNFSFTLTDGSTLTLNVKATSPNATAFGAVPAPSWTGAAVGNSAFIGIPGRPIIYTAAGGTSVVTLSNIIITAPAGVGQATTYMFVAADAESTDGAESLSFTTNGGNWTILDQVDPISGSQYPAVSGVGTQTVTESGNGLGGNTGGYIFGSTAPAGGPPPPPMTVSSTMGAGGLQGAMFAVRFASLKLTKQIVSSRINAADQFTYSVTSTLNGATLTSGTTSGSGNGPFNSAVVSLASGLPLTLSEAMAGGSVSPLTNYNARLTCRNAANVVTVDVVTASYSYGSLSYGDAINCTFTNTPRPRLTLTKALSATRVFTGDQFVMNVTTGATTVASTTTTGTGATIATGSTPQFLGAAGTSYSLNEAPSGTTNLTYYTAGMACTNAYTASTTTLPTTVGGSVSPVFGDNITCIITNTPKPNKANLTITKSWTLVSDPINGTTNPKMIPGAIVDYDITITNTGTGPVDLSTVIINDPVPGNLATFVGASAVTFINGTPTSGLSFAYPGNVTWTRTGGLPLVPDGAGYDSAVTNIRIAPTGTMPAASPSGQPNFTMRFRTRIQ
jgi:Surface adhesin CshA non-repetitive domain 2